MTHTVIIQGRFVTSDLDHDHFCLDNLSRGPPSGSLSVVRQHLTFPSAGALPVLPMLAKYWMTFFVFSVLPAPDSPLQGKENMHRDHQAEENLEAVNCTVILIMDLGCNPRLNTTMAKKTLMLSLLTPACLFLPLPPLHHFPCVGTHKVDL